MITVTDIAKQKIKASLIKRGKGLGIRIGVKTSGCSGLAYVLEYLDDDKFDPNDNRYVYEDFVIRIANQHIPYLDGLVIDHVKKGLNEGFEFKNPNARDECGCGESFRI